jgi:hypothetical protein
MIIYTNSEENIQLFLGNVLGKRVMRMLSHDLKAEDAPPDAPPGRLYKRRRWKSRNRNGCLCSISVSSVATG